MRLRLYGFAICTLASIDCANLLKAKIGRSSKDDITGAMHGICFDIALIDETCRDALYVIYFEGRIIPSPSCANEKVLQLERGGRCLGGLT